METVNGLKNLWKLLNSLGFWKGTVIGLILYKVLEVIVTGLLNKIRILVKTTKKSITFSIKGVDPVLVQHVKFGYLLVRYGTDELLRQTSTEKERKDAMLQNKEIYGKTLYDKDRQLLSITLHMRIHKTLGVQFKAFVDVMDSGRLNDLVCLLKKSEKIEDVKVSDSLKRNRIYFLLKDLPKTTTSEGIRNNYIFPK